MFRNEDLNNFYGIKIKKNLTPKDRQEIQKKWDKLLLTEEEECVLEKEIHNDIQNGRIPGYIDKNGKAHIER